MTERSLVVPALDGYRLAATLFLPTVADNGVIVQVNGAIGQRRERYRDYARYLAGQGFHVLTYNYRGIGDSHDIGWHGAKPTMQDWAEQDLAGVIEWIGHEYPKHRLVCVGHASGGQWLGLARNHARVHAQLAISAHAGDWRYFRARDWPRLLLAWYLCIPLVTRLLGRFPGRWLGSEDLPAGVALQWARSCRKGQVVASHFRDYRGRLRFYVIDDDRLQAPAKAVRALADCFGNADVQIMHVTPAIFGMESIGHFGFFTQAMPESAWRETADWLVQATRPNPLGQVG